MSEPKLALKFFKVKPDQLDEYGRLKPEAELHPFWATGHDDVAKLGQEKDLISPGSGVTREVGVLCPDDIQHKVGKDKWHGGSAWGYVKEDEPAIDSDDPEGRFGQRDEGYTPGEGSEYASTIFLVAPSKSYPEKHRKQQDAYFKMIYDAVRRDPDDNSPAKVPIIMLASDDDVIKYNDLLDNNFDAWRDDSVNVRPVHEVQLKRAIPMRQITMDDISKYKMPLDLGSYNDYLNFAKSVPLTSKEDKLFSFIRNKFLDKHPEYTGISNDYLSLMLGIPYASKVPYYNDVSEGVFNKYKKEYINGIYDPDLVMRNIFPADDKSTISDEQYKNILKAVYMDIPEHKKRQKNISNTLVDISRF